MKMETLKGKILDNLRLQNLYVRIVDVVNFEGPLLTLFENIKNKHLYLFDWVDRDSQCNRWLVYRCNPTSLDKFINEKISHFELFHSDEPYCFVVDIDKNLNWNNLQQIEKNNLPVNYLPSKEDFFEKYDCPNFIKLEKYVNQAMASLRQENLIIHSNLHKQILVGNSIEQKKTIANKSEIKIPIRNRVPEKYLSETSLRYSSQSEVISLVSENQNKYSSKK